MLALAPRGDDRAPGAEQSAASLAAAALLGCLVIVARYRGIHLSAGQRSAITSSGGTNRRPTG